MRYQTLISLPGWLYQCPSIIYTSGNFIFLTRTTFLTRGNWTLDLFATRRHGIIFIILKAIFFALIFIKGALVYFFVAKCNYMHIYWTFNTHWIGFLFLHSAKLMALTYKLTNHATRWFFMNFFSNLGILFAWSSKRS